MATRLRCLVAVQLKMCNAPPHVKLSCPVVTSAPELAMTANRGVHMRYVFTHVVGYSSVCIVAKLHAVSPAHPVIENVIDVALTKNAPIAVHSHVSRVNNRAPGVALITSATIVVEKNVTALDVMHPAQRSSLAATRVLVCVVKTAQQYVQFAMQKGYLLCLIKDVVTQTKSPGTCSSTAVTSYQLKKWMRG